MTKSKDDNNEYVPYVPNYKLLGIDPHDMTAQRGLRQVAQPIVTPSSKEPELDDNGFIVEPTSQTVERAEKQRVPYVGVHRDVGWNGHTIAQQEALEAKQAEEGFTIMPDDVPAPKKEPMGSQKNIGNASAGEYILLVCGVVKCTGSLVTVKTEIMNILYSNDPIYSNLNPDDLVVLKRMKFDFGVLIYDDHE